MAEPLAIDLYCGLGGWTDGLLAEGYFVIGFDIERHVYGGAAYQGALVLQNVLSLHGAQFKNAALIVASPPCQEYSYMAMPWTLAKARAKAIRADRSGQALARLNALFNACWRIQREASEAAGHHVPMVIENVKGAEPWVGRAAWSFGSYCLWGDIPALMPEPDNARKNPGFRFDGSGRSFQSESVARQVDGRKGAAASWFKLGSENAQWARDPVSACTSGSPKRKAASAHIAKIPIVLSRHIARVYKPTVSPQLPIAAME